MTQVFITYRIRTDGGQFKVQILGNNEEWMPVTIDNDQVFYETEEEREEALSGQGKYAYEPSTFASEDDAVDAIESALGQSGHRRREWRTV